MEWSSNVLSYLASVAVRSLILAVVTGAVILAFRIKSAAARHAVWTLVTAGMLVLALSTPLLPSLPWRVLRAKPAAAVPIDFAAATITSPAHSRFGEPNPQPPAPFHIRVEDVVCILYAPIALALLVRLAFGYAFTVRLVRTSRRIESLNIFESNWISVPLTVGWLRPKILLPFGWEQWDRTKLDAVLAHERTHVSRGDWAISVLAALNRSVFWFHPLAWWLEWRLASLAEQACDDTALLEVGTETYARALLDMAAAVKTGKGRLVWEAMAMAKPSEVSMRIERILDETREIPKALTKMRWAVIVGCALPLIYVASVVKPVRVAAQQAPVLQPATPKKGVRKPPSADEVLALEQQLAEHPHDLDTRLRLAVYYLQTGMQRQALNHIEWLITNHPESTAAEAASRQIAPKDGADYQHAAALWKQQAAAHPNDTRVLANMAGFLGRPGGELPEAEQLLLAARAIDSSENWSGRLAQVYAYAILSTSGDPAFPNDNPGFAQRAKILVQGSADPLLTLTTGRVILTATMSLPPSDHPLLTPIVEWAKTLQPPTPEASNVQPVTKIDPVYPPLARQARISGTVYLTITVDTSGHVSRMQVLSGHPLLVPAALEAAKQWTYNPANTGTFNIAIPFRLDGNGLAAVPSSPPVSASSFPPPADGTQRIKIGGAVQAAKLVNQVPPAYPPLAQQARISGTVHLHALIGLDGHVKSVETISGHPLLIPAALSAVQQWVYSPTLLNGQPVEVDTTVDVNFTSGQ
jgi:TonB family protein